LTDDKVKKSFSALRCMFHQFNVQKVRLIDETLARLETDAFSFAIRKS